jgi:hypothetical protein
MHTISQSSKFHLHGYIVKFNTQDQMFSMYCCLTLPFQNDKTVFFLIKFMVRTHA